MEANTWNEGCLMALNTIKHLKQNNTLTSEDDIRDGLAEANRVLGEYVRSGNTNTGIALNACKQAAVFALQKMENMELEVNYGELYNLLCRKQHDYGHQNIDNFGIVGVVVRMCDKIARADNLKKRFSTAVKNETIIDTYEDIVGYSVIAIMLDNNTFRLELE